MSQIKERLRWYAARCKPRGPTHVHNCVSRSLFLDALDEIERLENLKAPLLTDEVVTSPPPMKAGERFSPRDLAAAIAND